MLVLLVPSGLRCRVDVICVGVEDVSLILCCELSVILEVLPRSMR